MGTIDNQPVSARAPIVRRDVVWAPHHVAAGPDTPRLPVIAGAQRTRVSPIDSLGNAVRLDGLWIGGGAVTGAVLGAQRGHSLLSRVALGAAGALGGGALATAALTGVEALRSRAAESRARATITGRPIADAVPAHPGEQLKVVSLNIREGRGDVGSADSYDETWAKIRDIVQREHPDVLLLDEVTQFSPVAGLHDDLDEMQRELHPTDWAFAPQMVLPFGMTKGSAVLTFNGATLADAESIELGDAHGSGTMRRIESNVGFWEELHHDTAGMRALPDAEKGHHSRNATDALVRTAGGNYVRAVSTQLSGDGTYTGGTTTGSWQTQTAPLTAALRSWSGPTVLAGDFNVDSNDPGTDTNVAREARLFAQSGMSDTFTRMGIALDDPARDSFGTASAPRPLDRMYASDSMDVSSMHVVRTPRASDHEAIAAQIVIT